MHGRCTGEARRGQKRQPPDGGDPTAAKKCPKSEQTSVFNPVAPNSRGQERPEEARRGQESPGEARGGQERGLDGAF